MKNFTGNGSRKHFTPASDVLAGDLAIIGSVVGVIVSDANAGQTAAIATSGVFSLAKESHEAFAEGDLLYWNEDEKALTFHKTDVFVGQCWEDAPVDSTRATVKLQPRTQKSNLQIQYVEDIHDLPEPVNDVITLKQGVNYLVVGNIDLVDKHLETEGDCTINGFSTATCSITASALTGSYLIISAGAMSIRNLRLTAPTGKKVFNCDALSVANGKLFSLDGVAFSATDVGNIKNYANVLINNTSCRNANGFVFDGTFDSIAFNSCAFVQSATGQTFIKLPSTAVILRRIRVIYSVLDVATGATGIDISASATIPIEGYICDTVNFTGSGTYLAGVLSTDNKAQFVNNKGVVNSAAIGGYYMTNNATSTAIASTAQFYKIAGTTTPITYRQKFTHTSNRESYNGKIARYFKVSGIVSAQAGSGHLLVVRVAKNGTTLIESEAQSSTSSNNRSENIKFQCVVELVETNYIEIFIANQTATTAVTVTELSVIIEALN
jgi:predicted RecA/RadA family phage recombinase